MTPSQRRKYSRQYQNMIKTLEERYAGSVYNAIRKQVKEFMVTLREQGVNAARNHVDFTPFNVYLEDVVKRMYAQAGVLRASQVRSELREQQQKRFGRNAELEAEILDYLQRYILDKSVRPISQTTREWVLRKIQQGVEDGKGFNEIANWITNDPKNIEFIKYQALRIVRTETVRATNVGAIKAAESSDFETVKEWIAAKDFRTRHAHMQLDGQTREMDQDFLPNLAQPGDPRADEKLVINCRCCLAVVAKRDENGRLIMRQQNFAA